MANIREYKNKEGKITSYEIRVYRGRSLDGKQFKPYQKTWKVPVNYTNQKAQKEVQKIAILFEEECKNGNVPVERYTFEEYAQYVIDLKERNTLKHRTVHRYRSLLARIVDGEHFGIGHLKLDEIRPDHLNNLYAYLGTDGANKHTGGPLSAKTIREHHRLISMVLGYAMKEQLLMHNAAERATPPKCPRKEVQIFELEDIRHILDAAKDEPTMWHLFIEVLVATGARRGEVLGIRWESVNFENRQIDICNNVLYTPEKGVYNDTPKTGDSRVIAVPESVIELFRKWQVEQREFLRKTGGVVNGYVFTRDNGEIMRPDMSSSYLNRFEAKYNLPHINPHKFRHTQVSLLINAGMDVVTVSKRLGHKMVSTTTDFYAHIINKADTRASDVLDQLLFANKE